MSLSGAQEFTTEVLAPVALCFDTITDFERYPEWFSAVAAARVLERYRNGLGKCVEFTADLRLKSIRYVLAYEYEKPHALSWESIDGDVESIHGNYRFEKVAQAITRATCRQEISFGFWLPGPIRKIMEAQALRLSVLELMAAAEGAAHRADSTRKGRPGKG